jgi:cytochrome b561
MTMRDKADRYGTWAITLHWLLSILLVCVGILGLLHDDWPRHSQAFWINMHALGGLLLWIIVIWRIGLRLRQPRPEFAADFSVATRRLALSVHTLLYVLLFLTPLLGVATFIWHGRALDVGFFQVHFGVTKNRSIFEPTEDIHGYLAYAIFALSAFHILAALWHHFIKRDGVLKRMWWGT